MPPTSSRRWTADDAADLLAELPEEQQIAVTRRDERLHGRRAARVGKVRRRHGGRSDDHRLRLDLSAPHDRSDDPQDSRDRAGLRVHLLPLRARQGRPSAGDALAAHAAAGVADGVHRPDHGDRHGDESLWIRRQSTSPRRSRATISLRAGPSTRRGKMLGIVTVDDAIDAIMPDGSAKKLPRFTGRGALARRRRAPPRRNR